MSPGRVEVDGVTLVATSRLNTEAQTEFEGGRINLGQDENDSVHSLEYRLEQADELGQSEFSVRRVVNVPKARVSVTLVTKKGEREVTLVVD